MAVRSPSYGIPWAVCD